MKFHYLTDAEGDWQYFCHQIEMSEVVQFSRDGRIVFQQDNDDLFIFGGDLSDRGNDILIAVALNTLKEEFPERVVLLVGNRDANKTRFLHELPKDPTTPFENSDIPKPAFAASAKSYPDWLKDAGLTDTAINRLKWILAETMGAPQAFECRRREMSALDESPLANCSDEEVYQSFYRSVEEKGFMRTYLENAQLAAVVHDTLIVHGSVTMDNILQLPIGLNGHIEKKPHLSIQSWVDALNDWYHQALMAWINNQPTGDLRKQEESLPFQYSDFTPASALQHIASGHGSLYQDKSVVVGHMFDSRQGPLMPIADELAKILTQSGIRRVIVGHQPYGDTPGFITGSHSKISSDRSHHNIELITGDTLYGHAKAYDKERGADIRRTNPRGLAFATIHVEYDKQRELSQTSIKGIDGFGRAYHPILDNRWPNRSQHRQDRFLGRLVEIEGVRYLVRLNLQEGLYQLSHQERDFSIFYKTKSCQELHQLEQQGAFLSVDQRRAPVLSTIYENNTMSDGQAAVEEKDQKTVIIADRTLNNSLTK
jgi:hypothetical protein